MDAAAHETTPAAMSSTMNGSADSTMAAPTAVATTTDVSPAMTEATATDAALATDDATTATDAQAAPPVPVVKTPFERLRDVVDKNPLDFNAWVQLLSYVETDPTAPLATVEDTFDRFLVEFPLCFGYWNKYAQYELALASRVGADGTTPLVDAATATAKARVVYERGVVAVRHSVDMWSKYIEFLTVAQVPVEDARTAIEQAVTACGSDPMAGPLWDAYIALETMSNDMVRLNSVFRRILRQPLSNLVEFWEKYNHFVLAQQLQTLATRDELAALANSSEDAMDEGLLRVQVVNSAEAEKNATLDAMRRRQAFEAGIDRNYFHVTPVTDAALRNWHQYLDFEEAAGDVEKIEALYERCLIACANYEAFWLRFVVWQDATRGFDAANGVFQRATDVFLKHRASIHLEYATFLETHRKVADARAVYERVLSELAPTLVEAFMRQCNFERRCGALENAIACYERALDVAKQQAQRQPDVLATVVTAFATFLVKSQHDVERARAVFADAVATTTTSLVLWLNYIHFEWSVGGDSDGFVERIVALYQTAVSDTSELSRDEKSDMWFQYVEFLETYAPDVATVRVALASEAAWKRKHAMPRERTMKVLTLESSAQAAYSSSYNSSSGIKRARLYDSPVAAAMAAPSPVRAMPVVPVVQAAAAATAPYAQYYQGYQGYAATQTYPVVDATQAYTQAQYAAYYQQQ